MKKKWYLALLLLGLWAGSCAAVGFAVRSRMIRQLHFTEVPVACHTLQRRTPITEDDLCLRTLPASALSGFGEKSACRPLPMATISTTHLNVAVWSAALNASL